MYRIDSSSSSSTPASVPVAGTRGYFRDANPGAGVDGTIVPAWFLNMIQEEIENAVIAAGLTPNKGNNSQLSSAISALVTAGGISTGVVVFTIATSATTGWVMMNDGSIGNATSGGTARANADTVSLYTMLWGNVTNTWAPIQTSAGAPSTRGASAAADYAANKRLLLPRALGRALAASGTGSGLTARELGSFTGEEAHTLTGGEMQHQHPISSTVGGQLGSEFSSAILQTSGVNNVSASPHNNIQPSLFLNCMIKL